MKSGIDKGKARPVVRTRLAEETVLALTPEKIQAIAFAEVGAQGESEYVLVISDEGDHVGVTSGNFGFEAFGTRHKRDVDIEKIAEVVPFLIHFVGTSRETTTRGTFSFDKGKWLHLDMAVGNHFFIRKERFEPFRQLLAERNPKNLCMGAIDTVLDILKKGPCGVTSTTERAKFAARVKSGNGVNRVRRPKASRRDCP